MTVGLMGVRREAAGSIRSVPATVVPMSPEVRSFLRIHDQMPDSYVDHRTTAGTQVGLVRRIRLDRSNRQGGQPKKPHKIATMDTTIAAPTIA